MASTIRNTVLRIVDAPSLPNPDFGIPEPSLAAASVDAGSVVGSLSGVPKHDFPTITPARAKEFFDSPEGFGDWHVYISSNAVKHLREFRRADAKIFQIVQKKILELSQGFFSASNQKRLVGGREAGGEDGAGGVAIFEAKMTGDLRLVYQIELQTDMDLKVGSHPPWS